MVPFKEECETRFLKCIVEEGKLINKHLFNVYPIPAEDQIRTKCYQENGRKLCFEIGLMVDLS